jgi:hypothetical protein
MSHISSNNMAQLIARAGVGRAGVTRAGVSPNEDRVRTSDGRLKWSRPVATDGDPSDNSSSFTNVRNG